MADEDEDIWADNWHLDKYGGVDSQEDYLTFGATDYYQRAFSPEARGSTYAKLGPTQQEGPREGQQKTLQSYSMEAAGGGESVTPQDSALDSGKTFTTVPTQHLIGDADKVKKNVGVLTAGAGLTRSQTIFQNAVTRAAANYSSIQERVAANYSGIQERAADVFTRSRGG